MVSEVFQRVLSRSNVMILISDLLVDVLDCDAVAVLDDNGGGVLEGAIGDD